MSRDIRFDEDDFTHNRSLWPRDDSTQYVPINASPIVSKTMHTTTPLVIVEHSVVLSDHKDRSSDDLDVKDPNHTQLDDSKEYDLDCDDDRQDIQRADPTTQVSNPITSQSGVDLITFGNGLIIHNLVPPIALMTSLC